MSIIASLVIGAVAGWLAGQIVRGAGFGLLGNIVVGIIGSLAGILSSVLVPPPARDQQPVSPDPSNLNLQQELAAIRGELAALRESIERVDHR